MRIEPYEGSKRIVPESDLDRVVLAKLIEQRIRVWEEGTGRTLTIVSVEDGIWTVEESEADAWAIVNGIDTKPLAVWRLWVTADAIVSAHPSPTPHATRGNLRGRIATPPPTSSARR